MKKNSERAKIIRELIHTTDQEFTDEELIHQLTATKITRRAEPEKLSLGQRASDAVQAPLIMMSQNRQEAKDRERAENDYKVNLKNELIIDDLHQKLDKILENQQAIQRRLDALERK